MKSYYVYNNNIIKKFTTNIVNVTNSGFKSVMFITKLIP